MSQLRAPQKECEPSVLPTVPQPSWMISHLGLLSYAFLSWDAAKGESRQAVTQNTGTMETSKNHLFTQGPCLSHLALVQGAPVHYAFLMSDPSGSLLSACLHVQEQ